MTSSDLPPPNGHVDHQVPYSVEQSYSPSDRTETEFLIVGAGPAGASLACFLASYGKLRRKARWIAKMLIV